MPSHLLLNIFSVPPIISLSIAKADWRSHMFDVRYFFQWGLICLFSVVAVGCNSLDPSTATAIGITDSGSATETNTASDTETIDTVAPTLPSGSLPAVSNLTDIGLTLTWLLATDDMTADADLIYTVYQSTSNLTTQADWQDATKASQLGTATANLSTLAVESLSPDTTYYFMVMVTDQAGNITLYDVATATTEPEPIVDATAPVAGNTGTLTFTSVGTTGFTVSWTHATDNITAQEKLTYQVFYSTTPSNVLTVDSIDTSNPSTQGTIAPGGTSLALSTLSSNTTYYVNVVVTDETGNRGIYTAGPTTTSQTPDTTPPTVGTPTLTISNLSATSLTVTWSAATDDRSSPSTLQYQLYSSTSDNIGTVDNAIANGTTVGSLATVLTGNKIDLTANTTYYFNVVVQDEAGNKSAYTMKSQATNGLLYMFAHGSTHSGDLRNGLANARLGADAYCSTKKTASYSALSCTHIHGFLSVSSSDYIGNFPTQYGAGNGNFPTSIPIASHTGVNIASTWSDLISSSVGPCSTGSLCSGGGLSALSGLLGGTSLNFWTGTAANGSWYSGQDCGGGWLGSGQGALGRYSSATHFLLQASGASCAGANMLDLLCLCW